MLVLQYTSYSLQTQGTQLATSEILKHPSSAFRRGGSEFDLHSIYYSFYVHEHLVKKSLWILWAVTRPEASSMVHTNIMQDASHLTQYSSTHE